MLVGGEGSAGDTGPRTKSASAAQSRSLGVTSSDAVAKGVSQHKSARVAPQTKAVVSEVIKADGKMNALNVELWHPSLASMYRKLKPPPGYVGE